METALTLFKLDNFRYPTTEQGLQGTGAEARAIRRSATGRKAATSSA